MSSLDQKRVLAADTMSGCRDPVAVIQARINKARKLEMQLENQLDPSTLRMVRSKRVRTNSHVEHKELCLLPKVSHAISLLNTCTVADLLATLLHAGDLARLCTVCTAASRKAMHLAGIAMEHFHGLRI